MGLQSRTFPMREEELGLLNDFDRKLVRHGRHVPLQLREAVLTVIQQFTKS